MAGNSKKAVVYAFFINLIIALIKFVAAVLSGSKAMMAESFHSVADSINQVFLLLGMKLSEKKATGRYQYGFGKERYFWSFIVALGIFLIGGVVAIYEGIHKITEAFELYHLKAEGLPIPPELDHSQPITMLGFTFNPNYLSMAILGISILLEGYSWKVAMSEFKQTLGGRTIMQAVDDARDTTLVTVLFEDTAALLGLILAFIGVTLAHLTHDPIWDGIFSVAIGVLLVVVAGFISRITKALLIGIGVTEEQEKKIIEAVEKLDKVERVITIATVYFGPDFLLVTMKVDFQDSLDRKQIEEAIDEVEAAVRTVVPAEDVYVEADTFRQAKKAGKEKALQQAAH